VNEVLPLGELSAFDLDEEGWIATVPRIPSPNFDERPCGEAVSLIVVHAISLPPGKFGGDGVTRLFTNSLDVAAHPYYAEISHLRVSAHFLIRRDGALIQYVSCNKRAWHAGVSSWKDRERCNDYSIGIEVEGCDDVVFAEAQYACLSGLARALISRYPIDSIAGHSDVAPGRKTDPGPCFDWRQLVGLETFLVLRN
jgi:AmpD protein